MNKIIQRVQVLVYRNGRKVFENYVAEQMTGFDSLSQDTLTTLEVTGGITPEPTTCRIGFAIPTNVRSFAKGKFYDVNSELADWKLMDAIEVFVKPGGERYLEASAEYTAPNPDIYYRIFAGIITNVQTSVHEFKLEVSIDAKDYFYWLDQAKVETKWSLFEAFLRAKSNLDNVKRNVLLNSVYYGKTIQELIENVIFNIKNSDTFINSYPGFIGLGTYSFFDLVYIISSDKILKDTLQEKASKSGVWTNVMQSVVDAIPDDQRKKLMDRLNSKLSGENLKKFKNSDLTLSDVFVKKSIGNIFSMFNEAKYNRALIGLAWENKFIEYFKQNYLPLMLPESFTAVPFPTDITKTDVALQLNGVYQTRLELVRSLAQMTLHEIYQAPQGQIFVKPPLYNAPPYTYIVPEEIINYNTSINSEAIRTSITTTGALVFNYPKTSTDKYKIRELLVPGAETFITGSYQVMLPTYMHGVKTQKEVLKKYGRGIKLNPITSSFTIEKNFSSFKDYSDTIKTLYLNNPRPKIIISLDGDFKNLYFNDEREKLEYTPDKLDPMLFDLLLEFRFLDLYLTIDRIKKLSSYYKSLSNNGKKVYKEAFQSFLNSYIKNKKDYVGNLICSVLEGSNPVQIRRTLLHLFYINYIANYNPVDYLNKYILNSNNNINSSNIKANPDDIYNYKEPNALKDFTAITPIPTPPPAGQNIPTPTQVATPQYTPTPTYPITPIPTPTQPQYTPTPTYEQLYPETKTPAVPNFNDLLYSEFAATFSAPELSLKLYLTMTLVFPSTYSGNTTYGPYNIAEYGVRSEAISNQLIRTNKDAITFSKYALYIRNAEVEVTTITLGTLRPDIVPGFPILDTWTTDILYPKAISFKITPGGSISTTLTCIVRRRSLWANPLRFNKKTINSYQDYCKVCINPQRFGVNYGYELTEDQVQSYDFIGWEFYGPADMVNINGIFVPPFGGAVSSTNNSSTTIPKAVSKTIPKKTKKPSDFYKYLIIVVRKNLKLVSGITVGKYRITISAPNVGNLDLNFDNSNKPIIPAVVERSATYKQRIEIPIDKFSYKEYLNAKDINDALDLNGLLIGRTKNIRYGTTTNNAPDKNGVVPSKDLLDNFPIMSILRDFSENIVFVSDFDASQGNLAVATSEDIESVLDVIKDVVTVLLPSDIAEASIKRLYSVHKQTISKMKSDPYVGLILTKKLISLDGSIPKIVKEVSVEASLEINKVKNVKKNVPIIGFPPKVSLLENPSNLSSSIAQSTPTPAVPGNLSSSTSQFTPTPTPTPTLGD